jgi:hypothetical protein
MRRTNQQHALLAIACSLLGAYPFALPILSVAAWREARIRDRDTLWLLSILAFAVLSIIHGRLHPDALGVLIAWLTARGAARLMGSVSHRRCLGHGTAFATALYTGYAIVEVIVNGELRAHGPPWFGHANLYAHTLLVLGFGVATLLNLGNARVSVVVLAVVGIVLTGSRSGIVAMVVATAYFVASRGRTPLRQRLLVLAVVVAAALAIAVTPNPISARVVEPIQYALRAGESVNLLFSSNNLSEWALHGIAVDEQTPHPEAGPREWRVTRTVAAGWQRPQQTVALLPNLVYTLAGEFLPMGEELAPGFLGWAPGSSSQEHLAVSTGQRGARVHNSRGFTIIAISGTALVGGWHRLEVTFTLAGSKPVELTLGPTPDLRSSRAEVATLVRAMQLELGPRATSYSASSRTAATRQASLAAQEALARVSLWGVAARGFLERPFFGHGVGTFTEYFISTDTSIAAVRVRPAHPHNVILASLFDGGIVGLLATCLLVLAVWRTSQTWVRAVLVGLLAANLFDNSLFVVVVLFPLALLSGLGSSSRPVVPVDRIAGDSVTSTSVAAPGSDDLT